MRNLYCLWPLLIPRKSDSNFHHLDVLTTTLIIWPSLSLGEQLVRRIRFASKHISDSSKSVVLSGRAFLLVILRLGFLMGLRLSPQVWTSLYMFLFFFFF